MFSENYFGTRISSLSQSILVPGDAQLSFDYKMISGRDMEGPPSSDTFYAYLNGNKLFSKNNDSLAYLEPGESGEISGTMLIDVSSLNLVGQTAELKFVLFSTGDNFTTRVELDNVDITGPVIIVPVPSAMLLGGLGVVSVNWIRRRRVL